MKSALPNLLERIRPTQNEIESPDDESISGWFQRGVVAYESRQYGKALAAWKKAAAESAAEAHYRIGQLYARGEGVVQSIPDAVVWYKRAADKGHVDAQ
jgi:TPR repeat protein